MKLYGNETSPYVRKARVLALEKGIDCPLVKADYADPASPVHRLNPLGKIPVMEMADSAPLYDSPVIVEYLDSLKAPALIPAAGEPRWQALRMQALADGMVDATVARMLELRRPTEQQSAPAVQKQEAKVARGLDWAETQVRGRTWLVENRMTVADIALAVALDYIDFRYPHDWRARCPALAAWHREIRRRPSFMSTRAPDMK
jgi:glutathione S-transferase